MDNKTSDKRIRVLVIDDSALMRKMISDILNSDSRINVVATANDGVEGLEKTRALKPDVITLDVEMPRKNGVETLEEIMKTCPTPVIMLSSLTQEGAQISLKAFSLGCVDCIGKPSGTISLNIAEIGRDIIERIVVASTANIKSTTNITTSFQHDKLPMTRAKSWNNKKKIIVIGASTGGPLALQKVLTSIPGDFPAPIAIVQHMPPHFTNSFAKRLDSISQLKIIEGYDGLNLKSGMAVIAPSGMHMLVKKRNDCIFCSLSDAPSVLSVKPAANLLFLSAADEFGGGVVGVILTGMGKDGAEGAIVLQKQGAHIIAESKETCIIYGMPRAVIEAGVANQVLPLQDIAGAMIKSVGGTL
ncbi:MAG: chemotaxis response regulator protein-glutamate methylesterase [Synergistaceae bacterium]|nr:chemotaxis response regulator protein-glutamate methylesterase [Synergistaceae bacterium]